MDILSQCEWGSSLALRTGAPRYPPPQSMDSQEPVDCLALLCCGEMGVLIGSRNGDTHAPAISSQRCDDGEIWKQAGRLTIDA